MAELHDILTKAAHVNRKRFIFHWCQRNRLNGSRSPVWNNAFDTMENQLFQCEASHVEQKHFYICYVENSIVFVERKFNLSWRDTIYHKIKNTFLLNLMLLINLFGHLEWKTKIKAFESLSKRITWFVEPFSQIRIK